MHLPRYLVRHSSGMFHFMQSAGVSSEHRAQFVGHDLDDEHHAAYSRDYTPVEQLAVIGPALRWSLDLPSIRVALTATKTARKTR